MSAVKLLRKRPRLYRRSKGLALHHERQPASNPETLQILLGDLPPTVFERVRGELRQLALPLILNDEFIGSGVLVEVNGVPCILPLSTSSTIQGESVRSFFGQSSGTAQLDLVLEFSRRGRLPDLVDPKGVQDDQLTDGLSRLLGADDICNSP